MQKKEWITYALLMLFVFLLGFALPQFFHSNINLHHKITPILLSVFLLIASLYLNLSKNKFNILSLVFGFKTPWNIQNQDVWKKTNALYSLYFLFLSIIFLVISFFVPTCIFYIALALTLGIFNLYFFLYSKKIQENENKG